MKVEGRKHGSKDETGVMLATCRHVLVPKGLNMTRGEVLEYPYVLLVAQSDYSSSGAYEPCCVNFCWCRLWLHRGISLKHHSLHMTLNANTGHGSNGLMPNWLMPLLSVMRAKVHSWACQIEVA